MKKQPDLSSKIAAWLCEQRYLPYRLRKIVVKRLCPDILTSHHFEMDYLGFYYCGNTSNCADYLMFMYGACNRHILALMEDAFYKVDDKDAFVYVDIGPHVGSHALFMSKLAHRVLAFEAHQQAYQKLASTIRDNGVQNIALYPYGLLDQEMSVSGCDHKQGDEFFSQEHGGKIGVIRVNVHGNERKTLIGLSQTMQEHRPVVVIEFSTQPSVRFNDSDELLALLPEGYALFKFSRIHRQKKHYKISLCDFGAQIDGLELVALPAEKISHFQSNILTHHNQSNSQHGVSKVAS